MNDLGQILIDTKEGLQHGQWIKWLEDSRVGFTRGNANRYMKIAQELGNVAWCATFDQLSLNKLYSLASAPEEVKEEIIHSKDKIEAERKIKEYEEKLKQCVRCGHRVNQLSLLGTTNLLILLFVLSGCQISNKAIFVYLKVHLVVYIHYTSIRY